MSSRAGPEVLEKRKLLSLPGIYPIILALPAHRLVTMLTELLYLDTVEIPKFGYWTEQEY
jgi:hypothetical protein